MEKSLRTTNETVFLVGINLLVDSTKQNALCSPKNATKTETAAVPRFSTYISDKSYLKHDKKQRKNMSEIFDANISDKNHLT